MVHCSWCWGQGHNRGGCDGYKQHIKDNPNSYEAAREAEKVRRREARKKTPRKCGFCRKPGHNAKTCHTKQTIQQKYNALCSVYRRTVLEEMCVMGLGVGTLVNFTPRNAEPILALVTKIVWDRIYPGSDSSNYCVSLERVGPMLPEDEVKYRHLSNRRKRSLGSRHLSQMLSRPLMGELYQRVGVYDRFMNIGGPEMNIVSPINSALINPPPDWLGGKLSIYANYNPLKNSKGKDSSLWDLNYEMNHFAYFSGVLGMKENEKYFESFF